MPSRGAGWPGLRLRWVIPVAVALALASGPVRAAPDTPPPAADAGLTDNQLQGYACLAGATVAVALVALAGPVEITHVMGGSDVFWRPTGGATVVWTAVAAGAGALACAAAGTAVPAAVHAWTYLTGISWLHSGR